MGKPYFATMICCAGMVLFGLYLLHINQGTGLEPINAVGIFFWSVATAEAFKKWKKS